MSDPSRKIRRKKLMKGCEGKTKFETRNRAEKAARIYLDRNGEYMNVYYCPVEGGHWHIGHHISFSYEHIDKVLRES